MANLNLASLTSAQGFYAVGNNANAKDPGALSGSSVRGAGDINKDGFKDIIIGAYNANSGGGISYVIYGQAQYSSNINLANLTSSQGFSIFGVSGSQSGYSVSGAGDVNNDGFDDIIIGANYYNSKAGISYIIYGNKTEYLSNVNLTSLTTSQGFAILGVPSSQSGSSVSGAKDINSDGYADIIIGAPAGAGSAYVIYGNKTEYLSNIDLTSLLPSQGFYINAGTTDKINLGTSVSGVGDVNNDGYDDMIVGAPFANSNAGISYVLFGNKTEYLSNVNIANLASTNQGISIIGTASSQSGCSVSGAGHVNSDKYSDMIIGTSLGTTGASYVIYGSRALPPTINLASLLIGQGFNISGAPGSYIGRSVSGAGDVNRDTYDDVIIGPWGGGNSYVIYGGDAIPLSINLANLASSQGFSMSGSGNSGGVCSVSGVGDINNDTYPDIIVGAPTANSYAGQTYMVYGAISGFATPIPTTVPTKIPTFAPTISPTSAHPTFAPTFHPTPAPTVWQDSEVVSDLKLASYVLSPIVGLVFGWCWREKFAFYVLNDWGHSYKFIDKDTKDSLSIGEVGLLTKVNKANGASELYCRTKNKEILVEVDNGNNGGISKGLYDLAIEKLEQPSSEEYIFHPSEKNQLRDFLLNRNFIETKDLGFIKGNIYKLILSNFRQAHKEKYLHDVRIDRSEYNIIPSIDAGEQDNAASETNTLTEGLLQSDNTQSRTQYDNVVWAITRKERASYTDDVENRHINNILEVNRQSSTSSNPNNAVKNEKGCVLMCIAAMGPAQALHHEEEFSKRSEHLMLAVNEISSLVKEQALFVQNTASKFINYDYEQIKHAVVTIEHHPKDNIHFSDTNHLIISLLGARKFIEYLPIITHIAQSTINALGYNYTLPQILNDKPILISTHLLIGHEAAKHLPDNIKDIGLMLSPLSTGIHAVRLISDDYLYDKKQELLTQNAPINEVDLTNYCGLTMLAYTVPSIAQCTMKKLINAEAQCGLNVQLTFSTSIAVNECFSIYKENSVSTEHKTTTDKVIPYIADAISLAAGIYTYQGLTLTVMSATYVTHSISKIAIDMVPTEVKETYVDPVWDYVGEAYKYCTSEINEITGAIYDYFIPISY